MKKKKNDYSVPRDNTDEFSQKIPRHCPLCQNTDFIWGKMISAGYPPTFFPTENNHSSWWQSFKQSFRFSHLFLARFMCKSVRS